MPHRSTPPLLVTYATQHDPHDVREWSGSVYHVMRALRRQNIHVDMLGNLQRGRVFANSVLNRLSALPRGGHNPLTDPARSLGMSRHFARTIEAHLQGTRPDVLFSPSSIPIALVDRSVPKVFYTDATFAGLIATYSDGRPFPPGYLEQGHALEREAIRTSDLAIYASTWAARSAIEDYGADPEKLKVVPFGANLEIEPDEAMVLRDIAMRPAHRLELLFLGVAWRRKGGPKALEVARILHEQGIEVRLRVIGCTPDERDLPDFVEVIPFIPKTTARSRQSLYSAIRTAHFMLLPTTAECFGIVFSEASAFGVPSITHDVGGVSEAVREGRNGHLFEPASPAERMAERIAALFTDRGAYERLALGAFQEYRSRLNWTVNGEALARHLRSVKRSSLEPLDEPRPVLRSAREGV